MIARALVALAGACLAACAVAQETTVFSPRADDVAITIYRDGLALITETRSVELPEQPVTLVIEDVVETLLAQSAVIAGLGRPLAESNFDFDRLTPKTLLEKSIGQSVTLTRTNPATGVVTRGEALVLAVGEGVVLGSANGNEALYCSGLPERLELEAIPEGLVAKPRLSVKLAGGQSGMRTVKVSYLAHGLEWNANYVARLDENGSRMHIFGWATLMNASDAAFERADVALVAGRLSILDAEEGGSHDEFATDFRRGFDEARRLVLANEARQEELQFLAEEEVALLRDCFELPETKALDMLAVSAPSLQMGDDEIVVTGTRIRAPEPLGDYYLYRLPWRTDLGARQTKQVLFLDRADVAIERLYTVNVNGIDNASSEFVDWMPAEGDFVAPRMEVRWANTVAAGLGEPLPQGVVRFFEKHSDVEVFVGQRSMRDQPVGASVEHELGLALNLLVEMYTEVREARTRSVLTAAYRIVNNKREPVDLELRHVIDEPYYVDLKVERTSHRMSMRNGYPAWRFAVAPGETSLTYVLSAREELELR